jgi:Spy/CpxP family protein refolding chaperone
MKKTAAAILAILFALGAMAAAQGPGGGPQAGGMPCPMGGPGMGGGMGHGMMGHGMGSHGMGMPMGPWWKNSELVKKLGLSDDKVQQIEKIFRDHRAQLIDLNAALQKQELALEPLIEADQPNEAQVTAQIDRVAQARANLEKSHAQMLLAIRRVLTVEQWKQLRNQRGPMGPMGGPRSSGRGMAGPGGM